MLIAFACWEAIRLLTGAPGATDAVSLGVLVLVVSGATVSTGFTIRYLLRPPIVFDVQAAKVVCGDRTIARFDELAEVGIRTQPFFRYRRVQLFARLHSKAEIELGNDISRTRALRVARRIGERTGTSVRESREEPVL